MDSSGYLNKNRDHVMLVRGHNGAEATDYVKGAIRAQLEFDLDRRRGYGRTIEAVMISGGGNDIAGNDDMTDILKPDCSGEKTAQDCFRNGQPRRIVNAIRDAYAELIALVHSKIPGIPVFVHSYDYAIPTGIGFLGLGQWLQFPLDSCEVKRRLQQDVVNALIDAFAQMLGNLANDPLVEVVDTRSVLNADEWANELHPTVQGFNKLSRSKWQDALEERQLS